jgi:hypothetical protein
MEGQEADWLSSHVEHVFYGRVSVKNMQHIGRAPMGESVTYWQSFCGYLVSYCIGRGFCTWKNKKQIG